MGRPALVEGYGDLLTPVEWKVPFFAVIVKPPFGLPRRGGYEKLGREPAGPPGRVAPPSFREWGDLVSAVGNDFENAWGDVRPDIRGIKGGLLAAGGGAAGLCGRGPAGVGLFPNSNDTPAGLGGGRSAVFRVFRNEGDAGGAKRRLGNGDGRSLFVARNI